jgi:hypothetical protein
MTSALRSLANTEFWSTPISKSRPVSDLKRVTRKRLKVQSLSPAAGEGKTLPLIKQMTLISKGTAAHDFLCVIWLPLKICCGRTSFPITYDHPITYNHPITYDHPIFSHSSVSSVPPRSKVCLQTALKFFIHPFRSASSALISGKVLPAIPLRQPSIA